MNRSSHIFVLAIVAITLISYVQCQYPAAGVYVGINENFLAQAGQDLSNYAQTKLENYPFQDISGSSSQVKYTFHDFKLSINFADFYYAQASSSQYAVGWENVQYQLQWNYHICAKTVFNPCEDGTITVFTTSANNPVNVEATLNVNTEQDPISVSASATTMNFNSGAIQVNVHCSNSICVIPVGDIANEVAQNFVTDACNGITTAINDMAPTIDSLFNPIRVLPFTFGNKGYQYLLNAEGEIVVSSGSGYTPAITAALQGGIIVKTPSGSYYPSQNPTYVPESSQLEGFSQDYMLSFSGYFFESLFDAAFSSVMPMTIIPSEVPAASPVTLNTSDPFFTGVAPGLSQYPGLGIQVSIHSPVSPVATIDANGVTLNGTTLLGDFIIMDESSPLTAFTVQFDIDGQINTEVHMPSTSEVSLNTTIVSSNPNATIISSAVGPVDPTGFVQLLQMFLSVMKLPSFTYNVPSAYNLEYIDITYQSQLVQILVDIEKNLYR
ncbi:hypothetical protein CYY_003740 [Polysphondylium violaceum]|uniref:Lipid-binding serum glycoprotein C-terminal domain-containing protein n=1 Tax=Polysphondylium violaceum TaxID=133409 RepID=A0A8J4V001_9MYCE|nr:hypothetical protein CYY_003740 [Polysphondylium violaceum]